MEVLMEFYLDAKVRECWNNKAFMRLSNNKSIIQCQSLDDDIIYRILNRCVVSSEIASPIARWLLLLDLKEVGEVQISKITMETLRNQVMNDDEYINVDDFPLLS